MISRQLTVCTNQRQNLKNCSWNIGINELNIEGWVLIQHYLSRAEILHMLFPGASPKTLSWKPCEKMYAFIRLKETYNKL